MTVCSSQSPIVTVFNFPTSQHNFLLLSKSNSFYLNVQKHFFSFANPTLLLPNAIFLTFLVYQLKNSCHELLFVTSSNTSIKFFPNIHFNRSFIFLIGVSVWCSDSFICVRIENSSTTYSFMLHQV